MFDGMRKEKKRVNINQYNTQVDKRITAPTDKMKAQKIKKDELSDE